MPGAIGGAAWGAGTTAGGAPVGGAGAWLEDFDPSHGWAMARLAPASNAMIEPRKLVRIWRTPLRGGPGCGMPCFRGPAGVLSMTSQAAEHAHCRDCELCI